MRGRRGGRSWRSNFGENFTKFSLHSSEISKRNFRDSGRNSQKPLELGVKGRLTATKRANFQTRTAFAPGHPPGRDRGRYRPNAGRYRPPPAGIPLPGRIPAGVRPGSRPVPGAGRLPAKCWLFGRYGTGLTGYWVLSGFWVAASYSYKQVGTYHRN